MNDLEQHFKKATEQIRMTDSEKSAMRFSVQQEIAPSSPAPISTPSPYVWMFAPRSLAMLSVALLVIFSTGSAYASEGSLPGTPLYSVKTKIVEPLKVALAPTVQAKAEANASIARVRVQEAQTLAARGSLTPEVVQQISDSYNTHAKAALALAADIDDEVDVNTPSANPDATVSDSAMAVTMMTEPVGPVEPTEPDTNSGSGVVSITATAPVALSVSVEATSSEDIDDSETPSDSNTRSAKTFATYSTAQKVASTTRPVATNATTTETTRKDKSRNFVRTLRASLSAQAEILQKLEAGVRVSNERKEDN